MTTLENIRDALPGYARDLQLNLGTVLTPSGAPGLTERQIWAVALAAASASRNAAFSLRLQALAARHLDAAHVSAAHAAAAIMAMNNVYYRFPHLVEDAEYAKLPARLRMNVIGSPASRGPTSSCSRSRSRPSTAAELVSPPTNASSASTASSAKPCRARCGSPRPCTRWRGCSRA